MRLRCCFLRTGDFSPRAQWINRHSAGRQQRVPRQPGRRALCPRRMMHQPWAGYLAGSSASNPRQPAAETSFRLPTARRRSLLIRPHPAVKSADRKFGEISVVWRCSQCSAAVHADGREQENASDKCSPGTPPSPRLRKDVTDEAITDCSLVVPDGHRCRDGGGLQPDRLSRPLQPALRRDAATGLCRAGGNQLCRSAGRIFKPAGRIRKSLGTDADGIRISLSGDFPSQAIPPPLPSLITSRRPAVTGGGARSCGSASGKHLGLRVKRVPGKP